MAAGPPNGRAAPHTAGCDGAQIAMRSSAISAPSPIRSRIIGDTADHVCTTCGGTATPGMLTDVDPRANGARHGMAACADLRLDCARGDDLCPGF
jgi:hypothetical protein